ncbi:MAG: hypothetical protein HUJ31_06480 [Pseudomonadales bacterium]|nr:hypothetical protein [Pseudomonadales bacterium]
MRNHFHSPGYIIICSLVVMLSACQLMEAEEGDVVVRLVVEEDIEQCEYIGMTRATYLAEEQADDMQQASALLLQARNKAVQMGGDTVVSRGERMGDSQDFQVYRCGPTESLDDERVIGVDMEKAF